MSNLLPELLPTITIETGPEPEFTVIWLHGLGADGHDFEPIVPELKLGQSPAIRFIFPHAPKRPVTINGGMEMRAWYDIYFAGDVGAETFKGNTDHIKESAKQLVELVNQEVASGIPADHIILAGFSQGGAIILYAGLRYTQALAGIMALSTYLPIPETLADEMAPANKTIPFFMAHGLQDTTIPIAVGKASKEKMEQAEYKIEWHQYPVAHTVSTDEIQDIGIWL
ncbi:MAG: alpha/beta hydrolase, partial [Acidiferrobacterales bacterium]